jgi:toxin ParE1/3/4
VTAKPVVPRGSARQDIRDAVGYYGREAGEKVALQFVDAVQASFRRIGEQAAVGSPRYGHELGLPGLRSQLVERFPCLVFYIERFDYIEVWRILHGHRDIPTAFHEHEGFRSDSD